MGRMRESRDLIRGPEPVFMCPRYNRSRPCVGRRMMARSLKRALRLLVVLLSACATVVVPVHIQLATLKAGPKTVPINDTRSPADRVSREGATPSPTPHF